MTTTILTLWTVYDHPRDYPDSYVVRGQDACNDGTVRPHAEPLMLATTLDAVRLELERRGLYRLDRAAEDDPAIVETWV